MKEEACKMKQQLQAKSEIHSPPDVISSMISSSFLGESNEDSNKVYSTKKHT